MSSAILEMYRVVTLNIDSEYRSLAEKLVHEWEKRHDFLVIDLDSVFCTFASDSEIRFTVCNVFSSVITDSKQFLFMSSGVAKRITNKVVKITDNYTDYNNNEIRMSRYERISDKVNIEIGERLSFTRAFVSFLKGNGGCINLHFNYGDLKKSPSNHVTVKTSNHNQCSNIPESEKSSQDDI